MSLDLALNEFVEQLHSNNDITSDFGHVLRLKHMIRKISKKLEIDYKRTSLSSYFHGLKGRDRDKLGNFLLAFGHTDQDIAYLNQLETFTDINTIPQSTEEKILHDAHLLEGGPYFAVIKSLIKGVNNGRTFETAINTFEKEILIKHKCYFDYTRQLMREQIDISKNMITSLRENLPRSV